MPFKKKIDITHYIACLNEETRIVPTLKKIIKAAKKYSIKNEIIVIDDGSTDNTYSITKNFIRKKKIKNAYIIKRKKNLGIVKNYKYCLQIAKGNYFRFISGDDGEYIITHEKTFKMLYYYDLIIAAHTKIFNKELHRRIVSKVFTLLVNLISNNNIAYYNGTIAIKTSILRKIEIPEGFGFQSYLITKILKDVKKNKLKYIEFNSKAIHTQKNNRIFLNNIIHVLKIFLLIFIERFK